MDKLVYIGLGSNVGDRFNHIQSAVKELKQRLNAEILALSSIYETSPVGVKDHPYFLNAVCLIKTNYEPLNILKNLLYIEECHGRTTKNRDEPRTLDLDLLLYGEDVLNECQLTIPHPRIIKRAFVLVPLVEIDPNLSHPSWNMNVTQLLDSLDTQDTVKKVSNSDRN